MTDHIDVPIVATGDWIDAAWINQFIGDNVRAWRQAYTAAGMMAYALDSNTLAGLAFTPGGILYGGASAPLWAAPPAGLSLVKHDGSALSHLAKGTAYQRLQMNSSANGFEWANSHATRLKSIGNQTVGAGGPVLWDLELSDDGGWHSLVSNTERIVVPSAGRYRPACVLMLWMPGGGATARYAVSLRVNGAVVFEIAKSFYHDGQTETLEFPSFPLALNTNDYVDIIYVNGGVINMDYSYFSLERVP